jgi:hypothetical protein
MSQKKVRFGNHHLPLPASRIARITLGVLLVLGGIVGFLPVVGFWMIPLGALVLSYDIAAVRRARRRLWTWWQRRFGPPRKNGQRQAGSSAMNGDERTAGVREVRPHD